MSNGLHSDSPVLCDFTPPLARLTLNRPRAINSLNLEMIRILSDALDRIAADDAMRAVWLCGAGDRGFASGADVKWLRQNILDGDPETSDRFFAEEYALDLRIHRFPKPIVAVCDGITMGGGLGLAIGAGVRLATERTRIAMPETLIGFFPDVGASWFLNRLPGAWGMYLALTSCEIGGATATRLGITTHYVSSAQIESLRTALAEGIALGEEVSTIIASRATTDPDPHLDGLDKFTEVPFIDRHFSLDSVDAIRSSLIKAKKEAATEEEQVWASTTISQMVGSPTAMETTFRLIRDGKNLSLERAFEVEYAEAVQTIRHPDYCEGIRARLVDKDFTPDWRLP